MIKNENHSTSNLNSHPYAGILLIIGTENQGQPQAWIPSFLLLAVSLLLPVAKKCAGPLGVLILRVGDPW